MTKDSISNPLTTIRKIKRGRGCGRQESMVLRVARDVSTFVEPEPTAVFVCHLCPFRAEPRARANGPPSFTASITTRNVSLGKVVPFSRAKAATQTVSRISTGPTNGDTTLLIHWDGTGPPRCFSRIRLGRQEFATLFRHGLLFQFTFEALVSREQQPSLFLPPRFLLRSFFDGRSQERFRCLQYSFEEGILLVQWTDVFDGFIWLMEEL